MVKLLGRLFFFVFGFLALYCTAYYLVTGKTLSDPIGYILRSLNDMGDVNIWLQITDYWNTKFLPAWEALSNPGNVWEAIAAFFGVLFNLIWTPIQFIVFFLVDVFSILTSLFSFLSFSS